MFNRYHSNKSVDTLRLATAITSAIEELTGKNNHTVAEDEIDVESQTYRGYDIQKYIKTLEDSNKELYSITKAQRKLAIAGFISILVTILWTAGFFILI